MTVSCCPAQATSCTDRSGAPAENFTARGGGVKHPVCADRRPVHEVARVGQGETVIPRILQVFLEALHLSTIPPKSANLQIKKRSRSSRSVLPAAPQVQHISTSAPRERSAALFQTFWGSSRGPSPRRSPRVGFPLKRPGSPEATRTAPLAVSSSSVLVNRFRDNSSWTS